MTQLLDKPDVLLNRSTEWTLLERSSGKRMLLRFLGQDNRKFIFGVLNNSSKSRRLAYERDSGNNETYGEMLILNEATLTADLNEGKMRVLQHNSKPQS